MSGLEELGMQVFSFYSNFMDFLPTKVGTFINLFFISLVIVLYSILIWKFYRFIAKKNLIQLNLNKYNRSEHEFYSKAIKIFFYILEYVIILPFLVLFWFSIFTIFLILLTNNLEISRILIISTTVIVAIRMTSYYKEDLSKDIAKLLPFTLLGVAVTQSGIINFQNIVSQITTIPTYFSHIANYLIFIFIIEFVLRLIETFFIASGIEEETPEEA